MNLKLTRALVMLARVSGLVAVIQGALTWLGHNSPLPIHIAFGVLLVLALWGLAAQTLPRNAGLATAAITVGIFVPVLGLFQLYGLFMSAPSVIQVMHLIFGIAAIALAEIMAKRLRLASESATPDSAR